MHTPNEYSSKQIRVVNEILLGVLTNNLSDYPKHTIEKLVSTHSPEELQTIATGFENVNLAMHQSDSAVLSEFSVHAGVVAGLYWRALRAAVEAEYK